MFDDPRHSLQRLEEELQAAEATELEDFLTDDLEEEAEEDSFYETKRLRRPRNDAPHFRRTLYADEELDESAAVFVEKRKKHKKERKRRQKPGCLPIVLLLELAGIAGVIWWWLRWLQ